MIRLKVALGKVDCKGRILSPNLVPSHEKWIHLWGIGLKQILNYASLVLTPTYIPDEDFSHMMSL